MAVKAKWWQLQFRGFVAYYAAFIGMTSRLVQSLAPLNNGGSRRILGVGPHFNTSSVLQRVQLEFNVCVQSYYCKCLVSYLGHCFRHTAHPVTKLLSLPLAGRLASLRQQRPRVPSIGALSARELLSRVGVRVDDVVAGRPDVRGHSGYVFRWGGGWFEEIRDGGFGWKFERDDTSAIGDRVKLLLDLFRRSHNSFAVPALGDVIHYVQAAISNFQGEGPRRLRDNGTRDE